MRFLAHQSVFSTVLVVAVMASFASCGGDSGLHVGEPDQTSSHGLSVDEGALRATVLAGEVDIEVPLTRSAGREALEGVVAVELLDLAGESLGLREVDFSFANGETATTATVTGVPGVEQGTAAGDLARYVVRYEVTAGDARLAGRRSLFAMAARIGALVLGSDELYDGQAATLRVVAQDPASRQPLGGADVEVLLEVTNEAGEQELRSLWTGTTDDAGMAQPEFVPSEHAGPAAILVRLSSDGGTSESRHSVTVLRSHRVLITTDKPIYQPGQAIHIRALSLRLPDNQASAGAPVLFEVMDPKGNIVFREEHDANDYGVAATRFQLARMVNMGRYTIRATVDDAVQERTVTVDRYALPRFNIVFEADSPFYLPGELLQGHVDADYTFGQPVAGGSVMVRASQFDVDWVQFAELSGTTDGEGRFDFELPLPSYFVGLPLEQGGSFVKLAIEVTDTAGQVFEIERAITVAQGAVSAVMIPERPSLAPGVANEVYLLTSDPTGAPLATRCYVSVNGAAAVPVDTDVRGFGSFEVTPREGETLSISVEVEDGRGGSVTTSQTYSSGQAATETVLLRPDRTLYAVGDTANLTIYSPRQRDRVYLDAVRNGQTVLTDIVTVDEGWTSVPLDLSQNLAGSVTLSVYYIADSGDIVRDQRIIFVSGAADLDLDMALDRDIYLPAETATLNVQISDASGAGVQAAVGLQVVDEAVFAISEQRPGLERIYFQLEEELAEPRYEVHGFSAESFLGEDDPAVEDAETQQAARVFFAAASDHEVFAIDYASEREVVTVVLGHAASAVQGDASSIAAWLESNLEDQIFGEPEDMVRRYIEQSRDFWYDPWGQRYQVHYEGSSLTLDSAGVDELWGTEDDVSASQYVNLWVASRNSADGDEWDFAGEGAAGGMPDGDADWDMDPGPPADGADGSGGGGGAEPRIRTWFPETLFVEPSIITDGDGRATVEIPLADSITTWRASAMASSRAGALGSGTLGITVFQDFFVDLALPATLTLGDEITVPVVVYNYLDGPQTVEIEVSEEPWFTLLSPATQTVSLAAREVSSVPLTIRVEEVGWHELQAIGRAGDIADGLRRRIEVMPSGRRFDEAQSDVLDAEEGDGRVDYTFDVPPASVPGASELLVKIYPGVFAQAIEGLDSILRMPSGCFEQTSSSTYPNVMVLQYMQDSGTVTPEIEMQAREYINQGYQRLLTFEVDGGGFEWFGSPPAHKILTAYGLMEFSDMARVHPVDPALITRTAQWLADRQEGDGSWTPDEGGIAEGAINNYQDSTFRTTAYILWALLEAGYEGPAVSRGVSYVHGHRDEAADSYSRVIAAQALITADPSDSVAADLLDQLADEAVIEEGAASWGGEEGSAGLTYSMGSSHVLETTALVIDAFLRARAYSDLVSQGLTYLVRSKDSFGNWETTQATVYALRAMIRSMSSAAAEADGTIDVYHNGELVESVRVTPADYDVFRQLDLKEYVVEGGSNHVELVMEGTGSLMYQVVGTYWMPWSEVPGDPVGALSIDVTYDRTSLAVNDTATADVTITNNTTGSLMMVMVDLGIPPGFDLVTDDLDDLVAAGVLQRYERAGRQLLLYVDEIPAGPPLSLSYRLVARNPMRGEAPPASAYLYYEPDVRAMAPPVDMEVD